MLERCMVIDRLRLGRRVRELARLRGGEPDADQQSQIRHVVNLLARSVERRDNRERNLPRPVFDSPGIADLPVVQVRDKIAAAIRDHQVVVVCGATGSGKTTQLPKICLQLGRGVTGLIGHTQPRRIAARSVAGRIAHELGSNLGGVVGYKVRFTDQSSRGSYIKLMTDGILLAETQGDRMLAQYDTLIIDEAHERSLNIDFLLGYLKQLLPRRPDLKVIVTSATIDPESFAEHFRDERTNKTAPVIEVSGRTYPVEVRYRPLKRPGTGTRGGDEDVLELEMEEGVVDAVRELIAVEGGVRRNSEIAERAEHAESDHAKLLREASAAAGTTPPTEPATQPSQSEPVSPPPASTHPSSPRPPLSPPPPRSSSSRDRDILVFLPGEREIRETADELKKAGGAIKQCEVIPLFARLSTEEQNRIFAPHDQRRIILATNVAETSLTVPGIKYVIDSGLARISRYSPRIKVQRLPIEPISQASAQQRSGRCGRTSPGVCIRLYAEDDFSSRPVYTDPEILRTNLASVILQMKALRLIGTTGDAGARDVGDFPFLQPPDGRSVRDGYDTLIELGAFDAATGDLTDVGWKLAKLPVDPRIGRMIVAAADERALWEVITIAAALSVQDARQRPADKADQADEIHEKFRDPESDFLSFLKLWREFRKKEKELSGGQLRKWCTAQMLSYVRLREWQDVQRQLTELTEELGYKIEQKHASYDQIHRSLLAGLLSNIGHKGGGGGPNSNPFEYDGVRALKFAIFPGSALFREKPKWVMAAELVRTTKLYARTVAKIQPQWVETLAAGLVTRTHEEPHWMGETAQVGAYETVTLWGLPIIKRRRVHYGPVEPAQSRAIFIEHALVRGEYMTPGRFFEQNFKQQKNIEKLQERKRQHDLLADPGTRFEFYAQKLPADVYDGPGFERWRKKAEARQPDLLVMQKQDLLATGAVEPTPDQYPEVIDVPLLDEQGQRSGSVRVPLEYRHKHGDPADGLTAVIPATVLAAIDDSRFDWLVPGFAREKAVELIKLLPKATRVNLSPAAKFAEEAVKVMPFGQGDFLTELAATLTRLAKVQVSTEWWEGHLGQLPDHLRMNFLVLEEERGGGTRIIGQGKDLDRIRRELADRAAAALAGLPSGPYNRAGVELWDDSLGTLPVSIDINNRGLTLKACVALVDETPFGEHGRGKPVVGVRVFAEPKRARLVHARGVNRLLAMQVRSEAASLLQHTPGVERMLMNAAVLGGVDAARKDLAELITMRAFAEVEGLADVRDPRAFETALNAGWNRLGKASAEIIALAEKLFAAHQRVSLQIGSAPAGWAPTLNDVRNQLALLVGPAAGRFLLDTPWEWLKHYPRYLSGIALRLEKCGGASRVEIAGEGLQRDWRQMNEIMPLWAGLLDRLRLVGSVANASEAVLQFRWMLEELRISLFAQELRTAHPVSLKKLTARWEQMSRG
jgi:ATP-dependent helicase HrpA